jgi:hypothetical protein
MKASDIVQPAEDYHSLWTQRDYILPEPDQQLIGRLSSDAPVKPGFAGKEPRVSPSPEIGDLIAQKHYSVLAFGRRRKLRVIAAIPRQPRPIPQEPILLP